MNQQPMIEYEFDIGEVKSRLNNNNNSRDQREFSLDEIQNIETGFDIIPIKALGLFIRYQYLNIHELGRFILFVSKAMTAALFDDDNELWEVLCKTRFGEEVIVLSKSIPQCNMRHFVLSLLKGEVQRPIQQVRPLRYSPSDYDLILNIFSKKESKNCFSTSVPGSEVTQFFDSGRLALDNLEIRLTLNIGKDPTEELKFTCHLVRISDQKCCCLFSSQVRCQYFCNHSSFLSGSQNLSVQFLDATYVRALMDEIDESFEGFSFMAFLDRENNDGCIEPECEPCQLSLPHTRVFTTLNVETKIVSRDYSFSEEFPKGKNIKFAHFIEQLYGWDH